MAAITSTVLAIAGLAGTAISTYGQMKSSQAQSKAIDAQKSAESQRAAQMTIESDRRRREIIRQGQLARAQSLALGTSQGAADAGGSLIPAVNSTNSAATADQAFGVNYAQTVGTNLFGINNRVSNAYRDAALGQTISSVGTGIGNFTSMYGKAFPTIERQGGVAQTFGLGESR